jgi:hypothetical protein
MRQGPAWSERVSRSQRWRRSSPGRTKGASGSRQVEGERASSTTRNAAARIGLCRPEPRQDGRIRPAAGVRPMVERASPSGLLAHPFLCQLGTRGPELHRASGEMMEAFWGMVGVFVGGFITWFVQWDNFRRERAERTRVAAMQIASQLRFWLTETSAAVSQHSNDVAYDMHDDPNDVPWLEVPAFSFENSLDSISRLPSKVAQDVFGLIERKMRAHQEANHESFVGENRDASELLVARIAGIWVDGTAIYAELAGSVGWTEPAATEDEIARMRERAANLDEIRKRPSGMGLEGA